MTQEELAEKTGVSVRALGDLERGLTERPHRKSLELLADALGLDEAVRAQVLGMSRWPRGAGAGAAQGHGGMPRPGSSWAGPGGKAPEWAGPPGAAASGPPGAAGPRAGAAVPAQLPADIPDFTGRGAQVARMRALLAGPRPGNDAGPEGGSAPVGAAGGDVGRLPGGEGGQRAGSQPDGEGYSPGAVRVVLVVGAGGLGKTTLAVHVAHLLAREFPDGQLFASLRAATQPVAPAEVLARFLRDLGMDGARIPAEEEERAAQYRTVLSNRRVLIVLDDARDAAQVQPLLPGSGLCSVMVTARGQMPDLVGARIVDLGVLPRGAARNLFAQVIGPERALAEPGATEDVLAACAGLPLAIRIAGARLAARESWSVRALADRLADERRRLDELRAGNLAVRASFEVSFASLPGAATPGEPAPGRASPGEPVPGRASPGEPAPDQAALGRAAPGEAMPGEPWRGSPGPGGAGPARAFRLLGLWSGPSVSLPAAAALLGEPEAATASALDVLADTHLLESPAPDRYRFHDLLRVYAADRARTQETERDRTAAITRLLTWYLHTTEAAARVISPHHIRVPLDPPPADAAPLAFASLTDALAWCDAERAALMAATQQAAAAGLHEIAWKLAAAAMSYYYRRSHVGDWAATHQIGLSSARALGDRRAEAWILNNLGMVYGVQHREESIACFEQALTLSRETGDKLRGTRAANNIANVYLELGRFEEARRAAERALDLDRDSGDRFGEGLALDILGCACRKLGRYSEAVGHLLQSLAIFRDLDSHATVADALSELGETYLSLGQITDAITYLRESMVIYREVGDRLFQAITMQRLGRGHFRAGEIEQARQLFTEAVQLCEELGETARAAEMRADISALAGEAVPAG